MDEIQQTIFALNNLAEVKKQKALLQRDVIITKQECLRHRWKGGQDKPPLFSDKVFLDKT